ncbi:MAG: pyridoxal-phosphate dependent enzyme [Salibacteraceae bacterium]
MLKVISKFDLQCAYERIRKFALKTPFVHNKSLSELLGCDVFLKLEQFQPIGAFKIRGVTNFVLNLQPQELQKGLVTHSSGNHAQAVAYVADKLEVQAHIVMPENASSFKKLRVKSLGANLIESGPTYQDRINTCESVQNKTSAVYLPPFDHPWIISGQATTALEMMAEIGDLDAIITPLGGGGLLSGTALAAHYFSEGKTRVIGVEPELANDGYLGLQRDERITEMQTTTIADGLRTVVGEMPFRIISKHVDQILTVSEEEIIKAFYLIPERTKYVAETSSSVTIAALAGYKQQFRNKKVGVVLTGGNVDFTALPPYPERV